MKQHLKELEAAGPNKSYMFIKQARVKLCKNDIEGLLTYQFSTPYDDVNDLDKAIHYIMVKSGYEVQEGTAPPNDLERKIQKDIEPVAAQIKNILCPCWLSLACRRVYRGGSTCRSQHIHCIQEVCR